MPPKYNFFQYFLRAFGYLTPLLIPYILLFGISAVFSLIPSGLYSLKEMLSEFVFTTLMTIFPISIIYAAYKFSLKAKNELHHKIIIFSTLLIFSFVPGFLGSAAIGGASMAVVEGSADPLRFLTYLKYGLYTAFFAIPLNLIFTLIGSYFLYRRKND